MSSALKTPENTEEYPAELKSADEGHIQIECSLISCAAQVWKQQQKITCKNLGQYRHWLFGPVQVGLKEFCCWLCEKTIFYKLVP